MKFVVFGLGAIGSNLIHNLAKTYKDASFIGVDFDKVEERNLRTQIYMKQQIGMPKAKATHMLLMQKLGTVNYAPVLTKINSVTDIADFLLGHADGDVIFLDCFDNTASRQIISNFFKGQKYPNVKCLHIGFSPKYCAEIIWDEKYSVPNDIPAGSNDICQMEGAVWFIEAVVAMATMSIMNNNKNSYIITSNDKGSYFNIRNM